MAQILVRLKTNEGGDVIVNLTADKTVNNVSTALGTKTSDNDGVNGKSLATGVLSLKDGYLGGKDTKLQSEVDKYNGFMFGATDDYGNYEVKLTITGINLDKILIQGDKNADQFPTSAVIDEGTDYEKTIFSDDLHWGIGFGYENTQHTIKFTKWNRPNYNACFTTLKIMQEYLDLDRGWIQNVESLPQNSTNANEIQYGFCANSGSVKLTDLNGELVEYITDDVIQDSQTPIEIYVNNEKIQTGIMVETQFDKNTAELNSLIDDDFQLISNSKYLPRDLSEAKTANDLLLEIMGKMGYSTTEITNMLRSKMVDCIDGETVSYITVSQHLSRINIQYPYLNETTNIGAINKICELAQLKCYKLPDNTFNFVSARPVALEDEIKNAISIPEYAQITPLSEPIVLKNKYNSVKANYEQINYVNTEIYTGTISFDYGWDGEFSVSVSSGITNLGDLPNYDSLNININLDNINKIFRKDSAGYFTTKVTINGQKKKWEVGKTVVTSTEPLGITQDLTTGNPYIDYAGKTLTDKTLNINTRVHVKSEPEVMQEGSTYYGFRISDIRISVFANCVESETMTNTFSVGNGNRVYESNSNELLTSNTLNSVYNSEPQYKRNALTILNDYENGAPSGEIKVFYTEGETYKPQDIVYFPNYTKPDGSNIYWRVIGGRFDYSGDCTQLLELQKIAKIYKEIESKPGGPDVDVPEQGGTP